MAFDRSPHRFCDDESDLWDGGGQRSRLAARMHNEIRLRCPHAALDGVTEFRRPCHPVLGREHSEGPVGQAVSERRPLRRRSATMARPARVRIRKRKPCTLARRRLLGWKVRLPLATAALCCHVRQPRPVDGEPTGYRDCRC